MGVWGGGIYFSVYPCGITSHQSTYVSVCACLTSSLFKGVTHSGPGFSNPQKSKEEGVWDLFYWLSRRAAACTPASNRALLGTAVCGVSIVIRLGPNSFVLILFCDLTNALNNQTKSSLGRGDNGWLEDYIIFQPTPSYWIVFLPGTLSPLGGKDGGHPWGVSPSFCEVNKQ